MRYTLSLLALLLAIAASCVKPARDKAQYEYFRYCHYTPHTRVDTMYNPYLQQMQYVLAFDTTHVTFDYGNGSNRLDVTDADFGVYLKFQADSGVTDFSYTDAQLKDHKVAYSSGGGLAGQSGYQLLEKGTVSGKYLGDYRWNIYINVTLNHADGHTGATTLVDSIMASYQAIK